MRFETVFCSTNGQIDYLAQGHAELADPVIRTSLIIDTDFQNRALDYSAQYKHRLGDDAYVSAEATNVGTGQYLSALLGFTH